MLQLLLIDPQLSWKHWLIKLWYKSVAPWVSRVYGICNFRVVICIPSWASPSEIHITTLRAQIPYTLEMHGTTITYTYRMSISCKSMGVSGEALQLHAVYEKKPYKSHENFYQCYQSCEIPV